MAGGRVAGILVALAAAGPVSTWPDRLVEQCREVTEMTGVGIALSGAAGLAGVLAATGGHAQRMEDLQFTIGEGPCVDASTSGRPVLCPDIPLEGAARWPAYASGAAEAGIAAAFTFPLQVGAIALGVLDLYRDSRGPLTGRQVDDAVAFADAAVAVLLYLQERANGRAGGLDGSVGPPELVDRRAVVHQAVGMISVQVDVGVAEALLRLRAHAYGQNRPVVDVATDVVARRLRFDDSDAGTSQGSGGPDPDDDPEGAPG